MNKDIQARWTARLREHPELQGKGYLRKGDKRCCLGVLCDIAVEDGVITAEQDASGVWYYDGASGLLPHSIQRWAGLGSSNPVFSPDGYAVTLNEDGQRDYFSLANANDGGTTFAVIADIIDEQL